MPSKVRKTRVDIMHSNDVQGNKNYVPYIRFWKPIIKINYEIGKV